MEDIDQVKQKELENMPSMPVYAGDQISVKVKIVDMYEKQGRSGQLIFTTSVATYTNQDGNVLAKQTITMIATPRKEA